MVVHAFNPSTQEAEAGRFLSSRPARAIKRKIKKQNPKKPKHKTKTKPNQTKKENYLCVCVCVCVCVCRPEDNF